MSVTQRPVPLEQPVPRRRSTVLAPFRYRDFRLLFAGLLVSNLGTWMQITALGYLVVQIAGTARLASLDVGILGAASAVPVLLFSPVIAGVVADRFPRRRVLFVTNSVEVLVALALAVLTSTHRIELWQIFIIAGIRSTGQSFDAPARQSWVPLLVPREYLGNAIGLNSVAFNAPSVLGPPIAGILISTIGIAVSFYLNALLTFGVVAALFFMRPPPPSSTVHENVFASIVAGLRFLFTHPVLRSVILLLLATCLLVRPSVQLLPAYAQHVAHVDARGLGLMLAAVGAGAICGSFVTAILGARRRGLVWFASALAMALGVAALGSAHSLPVVLAVLALLGLAVLSFAGSSNVLLQTLSPDDMRGRAISVFSMIILGLVPAGSLVLGSLASVLGLPETLQGSGVLAAVIAVLVWSGNAALRAV